MGKVIIGIHGLANKPERAVLSDYWERAIREGLQNIGAGHADFDFRLVYWADYLYRYPMHEEPGYEFDDLYNTEPYIPAAAGAIEEHVDSWRDDVRKLTGSLLGKAADWAKRHLDVESLANFILSRKLKDLDYYYANRPVKTREGAVDGAKSVLQKELETAIEQARGDEILLIAHSMGSIIAYDVLRNLGRTRADELAVQHFVTIGSPLGLPHVIKQVVDERTRLGFARADEVRTPSIVTGSWDNYADPRDPVSLDAHLADDYGANDQGVKVRDDVVSNDYVGRGGESNPHKSFGYLRTPELSRQIKRFIGA